MKTQFSRTESLSPLLLTYDVLSRTNIHYNTALLFYRRPDVEALIDNLQARLEPEKRMGVSQLRTHIRVITRLPLTIKQGVLRTVVTSRAVDISSRAPACQ